MNGQNKALFVILIFIRFLLVTDRSTKYQIDIPADEFKRRQNRIFASMDKDALAVLQCTAGKDRLRVFWQSSQFYYLCGLETPGSPIVLADRNREKMEEGTI